MKKKFYYRGVVEGFYGREWTMEERKNIIEYMGKHDYNLYIYAAKADKLHRDEWKVFYGDTFLKDFKKLIDTGKKCNVEVSIAISPGLSLIHSNEEDLDILIKKFKQFSDLGVNTLCLFLDDIPWDLQHEEDIQKYDCLAQAQADFSNKVFEKLSNFVKDLHFILCPTEYFGKPHYSYHDILGNNLNKNIDIMWTGPKVCSKIIPDEDAIEIGRSFKRPVIYWDNYPVNDSMMVPELHMAEYIGRSQNLYKYSKGIVINPMNQANASKIVLGAISEYLLNPEDYNSKDALLKSLKEYNSEIIEEFYYFIQCNSYSPLTLETSKIALNILEKFETLIKNKKRNEAKIFLKDTGNNILKYYDILNKKIDPKLKEEIKRWLEEFKYYGTLMIQISDLINTYEIIFDENAPLTDIEKVKKENKKMEDLLKKFMEFETSIFSEKFVNLAWKHLKISKGLIRSNNIINQQN
jgi:hyaluronoglucosaminidase